jgi:hypothetical protein
MSGQIERRAPHSGRVARNNAKNLDAGQATEISQLSFDESVLEHSKDMPAAFRSGARAATQVALAGGGVSRRSSGELISAEPSVAQIVSPRHESTTFRAERAEIASSVRQLDKPLRSNGRVVQRRTGWRATPDRIINTIAERELKKNSTGTYSPAGQWLIEIRRTFRDVNGKASKRTGSVPVDPEPSFPTESDGDAVEGLERTVMEKFPDAARALGALPAAVRSSAIARVPSPVHFEGQLVQFSNENTGAAIGWKVTIFRMDAHRAVVITGTRDNGAATWSVAQAAYKITDPEIELG